MKLSQLRIIQFAILFLFFIQLSGTLIESIYILDLLNTTLDAKALGLLFFFTPLLLMPFRKKLPVWIGWFALGLLIAARGVTPYLNTAGRLSASGIGTGVVLILFPFLLNSHGKVSKPQNGLEISIGLALATALSVFLRTVHFSIDYSLTPTGGWLGWIMAFGLGWIFVRRNYGKHGDEERQLGFAAGLGLMLVLALLLFSFSAPAVITRWTEGNYALIVIVVSIMTLAYAAVAISHSDWIAKLIENKLLLWGGNLLFGMALVGVLFAHRVAFPVTPESLPVVVSSPTWIQQIPLGIALLMFPIIYVDAALLLGRVHRRSNPCGNFISGQLVGLFLLVVLIFMQIFTNVWGYVEPISPFFRNKFWLPFSLMTSLLTLLVILSKSGYSLSEKVQTKISLGWRLGLGVVFLLTAGSALWSTRPPQIAEDKTGLTVMTYNIQQANDGDGEKSYLRQLALIRQINPDILALQESDSSRVSLNNNDYVRYYASVLGYYSYYGPTTVTGSYGTAILSRYPLENVRTVFSYSDTDEIGTAEAEVVIDGQRMTIYCVHPDGSDTAMLAFADTVLKRSEGKKNVIALGDYNLRNGDKAYQRIAAEFHSVQNSEGHIDHIFLSSDLQLLNPVYISAPESATDHPLLYAEVRLEK